MFWKTLQDVARGRARNVGGVSVAKHGPRRSSHSASKLLLKEQADLTGGSISGPAMDDIAHLTPDLLARLTNTPSHRNVDDAAEISRNIHFSLVHEDDPS